MSPTLQSTHLADIAKTKKKQKFFKAFAISAMLSCSQVASKSNKKSSKNQSKKWSMTRWMMGWVLDGSWADFWWILGPCWEVRWGQVGTKIQKMMYQDDIKKSSKNI